jgi:hypothetical protein
MQEREHSSITRLLCSALLAACLLQPSGARPAAQIASATSEPQSVIDGPLYPARKLRAFKVFGVHLNMPATEAVEALTAAGLVPQDTVTPQITETPYDVLGNFNLPQSGGWVQLHYTKLAGNEAVISGINYWRKLPGDAGAAVDRLRAEMLSTYGAPTVWTQQVDERGALRDSALYVSARLFVDSSERRIVHACVLSWVCTELQDKVDCRDLLKRSAVPMAEIRFAPQAVIYQMSDYGPVYGALARDARFRGEEPTEAACPAPAAD